MIRRRGRRQWREGRAVHKTRTRVAGEKKRKRGETWGAAGVLGRGVKRVGLIDISHTRPPGTPQDRVEVLLQEMKQREISRRARSYTPIIQGVLSPPLFRVCFPPPCPLRLFRVCFPPFVSLVCEPSLVCLGTELATISPNSFFLQFARARSGVPLIF